MNGSLFIQFCFVNYLSLKNSIKLVNNVNQKFIIPSRNINDSTFSMAASTSRFWTVFFLDCAVCRNASRANDSMKSSVAFVTKNVHSPVINDTSGSAFIICLIRAVGNWIKRWSELSFGFGSGLLLVDITERIATFRYCGRETIFEASTNLFHY